MNPDRAPAWQRILRRTYLSLGRLRRGMLLGVRGILLDGESVLLVRHTYVPGWYLPGGGVEAGETAAQALRREAREEAGAEITGALRLIGFHWNPRAHPRDHVVVYACEEWRRIEPAPFPNLEIADCRLFPLDALPEDATPATRARLAEYRGGAPSEMW